MPIKARVKSKVHSQVRTLLTDRLKLSTLSETERLTRMHEWVILSTPTSVYRRAWDMRPRQCEYHIRLDGQTAVRAIIEPLPQGWLTVARNWWRERRKHPIEVRYLVRLTGVGPPVGDGLILPIS